MRRCLLAVAALAVAATLCHAEKVLFDFEALQGLPPHDAEGVEVALVPAPSGEGKALKVAVREGRWPGVALPAADVWDWRGYAGIAVDVSNPGEQRVRAYLRVSNAEPEEGGPAPANVASIRLAPGETAMLALRFKTAGEAPLWGMGGYPVVDGYPTGPPWGQQIDAARIAAVTVGLGRARGGETILVDNIRLWGEEGEAALFAKPFIDRYGQYMHQDWPGKVGSDEELVEQREAERRRLEAMPPMPERDEYGGWASGPKLEATGWFRTEKVDGKWWLVTPKGTLFFSNGIDCVILWYPTFITEREDYFRQLPPRDGPLGVCYGFDDDPHGNTGPLGEAGGETLNFYQANLIRKYGEGWREEWMDVTFRRMAAWGFNTVASWSDPQIYQRSPLPFVVEVWLDEGPRRIDGMRGGYRRKMHDAYAPSFEQAMGAALAEAGELYGDNPLCLGYFVDNELSWGGDGSAYIAVATLESPPDQPCRQAMVRMLEQKHGSLAALNEAWGTEAASWDELRAPQDRNDACTEDLNAFIREFSLKYFRTVDAALARHAPHQLYLGCRFASRNRISVDACAEVADVVSFNIYSPRVEPEQWGWTEELGKPCIIGEFHSGATDRGSVNGGIVEVSSQAERARTYIEYVNSVADLAAFVGCHWFMYMDEPVTGRSLDGENYNAGLVSITDTPYYELLEAARKAHEGVYERRFQGPREERGTRAAPDAPSAP
ncbi:MAG: beta-galactosidase [Planctomycetota bacterium]|jgi:hypothetical protein